MAAAAAAGLANSIKNNNNDPQPQGNNVANRRGSGDVMEAVVLISLAAGTLILLSLGMLSVAPCCIGATLDHPRGSI